LKYHGTGLKQAENGKNKPYPVASEEISLIDSFKRYEACNIAWLSMALKKKQVKTYKNFIKKGGTL